MKGTYWDSLNSGYHFEVRKDQEYLADLIKPYPSLLEHSVGTGALINILRQKGWQGTYTGTDYADCFIDWAKKNNPNEEFVEHNLFNPSQFADNSFDCVAVHHGLEYVYPYRDALDDMRRVAREYVFVTFWVPFTQGDNEIRFTEERQWNVNFYNEDEWYYHLAELNFDIELRAEFHEKDRYNHLFMLKV